MMPRALAAVAAVLTVLRHFHVSAATAGTVVAGSLIVAAVVLTCMCARSLLKAHQAGFRSSPSLRPAWSTP